MTANREDQVLQRYPIQALDHGIYNSLIIGVIIGKQPMRQFVNRNGGAADQDRAVWNFTLRDSVPDFMNVTVWGSAEYVSDLYSSCKVGDVVEIRNARIDLRQAEDNGEQYRPTVTSPFHLTANENTAEILPYEGMERSRYQQLARYGTKPMVLTVSLADVQKNINTWKGDLVDLLVVVQQLGAVRTITTKDNAEKMVREILVFDASHSNFLITLWDEDYIERSNTWTLRQTLLYMADVKIVYNDFKKVPTVALASKSIMIVDPFGYDAEKLLKYAREANIEDSPILGGLGSMAVDPNTIKTVMNCSQISNKIKNNMKHTGSSEGEVFTAITYSFVIVFDLDGFGRVTSSKCSRCKAYIPHHTMRCANEECVNLNSETETILNVKMTLSDHSGTLDDCYMSGKYAENILQVSVNDFLEMRDKEKEDIKWNFLLERCKIKLMVACRSGRKPRISVLTCEVADIDDVLQNIPQ